MTGVRILSVVTLGSLHWTRAVGQGVVTDFVLVDSGSDAVWLRLPESVAGLSAKRDLFAPGFGRGDHRSRIFRSRWLGYGDRWK